MIKKDLWKFSWLLAVLISFITLSSTLNNGWVNWDDEGYVLNNPLVKSLSLDGMKAIFSHPNVVGNYHPITVLSLAIDHYFFKYNAIGYHAHSLLIHLLNTFLLFIFSKKLLKDYSSAFIVSLLFGIHPMHVESVAWISARKDLLFTFFMLLGLISYLNYLSNLQKRKKWINMGLCLTLFVCSLLSKSQAIPFPIYLLLIDYVRKRNLSWKLIREKVLFFVLSFSFVAVTFYTQNLAHAIVENDYLSFIQRLAIACYSSSIYLLKSAFPFHLSAFYPYPFQDVNEFPIYFYFYLLFIPQVLGVIWYALRKQNTLIVFGFAFFLVSLAPILQFIPAGRAMMAERYTYIAYFGLFIIAAHFILMVREKLKGTKLYLFYAMLFSIFLCFSIYSFYRGQVWQNGETLWSDVIHKYPANYFGYACRSEYYLTNKQLAQAGEDIQKSISLYPHYGIAFNIKGRILEKQNKSLKAKSQFLNAITVSPNYTASYVNISKHLAKQNKLDSAKFYLDQAINLDKNYSLAYINRAVICERLDLDKLALIDYNQAIDLEPSNAVYYRYRGVFHLSNQQTEFALADLTKSIKLKQSGISYFLRSKAYALKSEKDLALKDARMAIKLNYPVDEEYIHQFLLKE